jgi:hypothetical protein
VVRKQRKHQQMAVTPVNYYQSSPSWENCRLQLFAVLSLLGVTLTSVYMSKQLNYIMDTPITNGLAFDFFSFIILSKYNIYFLI